MKVEPLAGKIGARVTDINLGKLDDALFEQVAQALWQHQVLVFPEQNLAIEDHVAVGKRFGPLHTHPSAAGVDGHGLRPRLDLDSLETLPDEVVGLVPADALELLGPLRPLALQGVPQAVLGVDDVRGVLPSPSPLRRV